MEWLFGSSKSQENEASETKTQKSELGRSTPSEKDESWYRDEGNKAFQQAQYRQALSLYTQGLVRQPSAVLYCNRSVTAYALGDYGLALQDAERAMEMDKKWVKPYLRKGKALSALGRYKGAAETLAAGLELSISGVKQKTKQIETELDAVKKQAQNSNDAYLELLEKHRCLQRQFEDYQDMFGDYVKKQK